MRPNLHPRNGSHPDTQPPPPREQPAGADQPLRVLIADPDGLARSMIRAALLQIDRIAIALLADNAREALELARYYHPAVTIIDTALAPNGGVQLIAQLQAASPATRIVMVSTDDQQAIAGLRAGAIGHIRKDIDPDELTRLITRVADGEAIIPQRLLMPLLQTLREIPQTGWRPLHSRLTTREWEIIELIGQDASTQRIAERLVLSPTTVYSHIKNILRKLGVHSRRDAITAAEHLRTQEAQGTKPPDPTPTTSPS